MRCIVLTAWIMLGLVLAWDVNHLAAQQVVQEDEQVPDAVPTPSEPASPPPGEEVMRPTTHGLRFTRKMADGWAGVMAQEVTRGSSTDEAARQKLARLISDRMWNVQERHAKDGAGAIEAFYEMLLLQEAAKQKITPEEGRAYSERVRPGIQIVRDFWDGLLDDADPLLDDEAYGELEQMAKEAENMTRRFDKRMERWSRGEMKENEGALQGLDRDDPDDPPGEQNAKPKEYVRAERDARRMISRIGTESWQRFLEGAERTFKFDESQKQAGRAILRDYKQQADTIMTPEWKAKAKANRVQVHLQWSCPEEPLKPWVYHLGLEYKQLVEPVQELGRAFRRDVVALASPEQYQRVLADLQEVGTKHGMTPDELAAVATLLAQPETQPETN